MSFPHKGVCKLREKKERALVRTQSFIRNHTEIKIIILSIAAIIPANPPTLNIFIIDDHTNIPLAIHLIKLTINTLMLITPFIKERVNRANYLKAKRIFYICRNTYLFHTVFLIWFLNMYMIILR